MPTTIDPRAIRINALRSAGRTWHEIANLLSLSAARCMQLAKLAPPEPAPQPVEAVLSIRAAAQREIIKHRILRTQIPRPIRIHDDLRLMTIVWAVQEKMRADQASFDQIDVYIDREPMLAQ